MGGDITVQRFFGTAETWRLVSSPVAAQDIDGDWTPSGNYAGGHGYDFYAWHEPSREWLNQKDPENGITGFVPGEGYLVSFESENHNAAFSGALNEGDIPVSVTRTANGPYVGSNLLGNPYASGIDWHEADRGLFVDDYAYVYDRNTGEHGTTEGYLPVDGSAADAWIGAHQGFFVLVEDEAKTDFEFTEDMMAHGGEFTKEQPEWEQLILHLNNDTYYHQTTIRLNEESVFERDRMDAIHFYSMNNAMPQVYSFTADEVKVAINSIPEIDEDTPIQLGLHLPGNDTYHLSMQEFSGGFRDFIPYLEDMHTGEMVNLEDEGPYSFFAEEGELQNRFQLHLKTEEIPTGIQDTEGVSSRVWAHNNQLYVDAEDMLQMVVYDINGRRQIVFDVSPGRHVYPLNLAAGVYLVTMEDSKQHETIRVVVQ